MAARARVAVAVAAAGRSAGGGGDWTAPMSQGAPRARKAPVASRVRTASQSANRSSSWPAGSGAGNARTQRSGGIRARTGLPSNGVRTNPFGIVLEPSQLRVAPR